MDGRKHSLTYILHQTLLASPERQQLADGHEFVALRPQPGDDRRDGGARRLAAAIPRVQQDDRAGAGVGQDAGDDAIGVVVDLRIGSLHVPGDMRPGVAREVPRQADELLAERRA